jgi:hypothetical protein
VGASILTYILIYKDRSARRVQGLTDSAERTPKLCRRAGSRRRGAGARRVRERARRFLGAPEVLAVLRRFTRGTPEVHRRLCTRRFRRGTPAVHPLNRRYTGGSRGGARGGARGILNSTPSRTRVYLEATPNESIHAQLVDAWIQTGSHGAWASTAAVPRCRRPTLSPSITDRRACQELTRVGPSSMSETVGPPCEPPKNRKDLRCTQEPPRAFSHSLTAVRPLLAGVIQPFGTASDHHKDEVHAGRGALACRTVRACQNVATQDRM